jgi:hypothetical protein
MWRYTRRSTRLRLASIYAKPPLLKLRRARGYDVTRRRGKRMVRAGLALNDEITRLRRGFGVAGE